MRVLGIDTTGPGGGAALWTGGDAVLARVPDDVRRGRTLVPIVRQLLADAGLRVEDLDLVACGIGPGSFTGIRIGIATAAALAYAAGKPVAPVGSLHGIAHNAPDARHVLVCLDARRGNVYSALFDRLALVGEYRHGLRPTNLPAGTVELGDDAPVRPDVIARLGWEGGERVAPHEVRPLYMRRSDPEIRRGG